jgi:hypothetical protein
MKNPPSSTPRFRCRLVRLWCPDTGPHPRHAESCADCREYFRASDALDSALRRDAVRNAPEFPAGLERSILLAVRASSRAPARSSRSPWFLLGGGLIVAAAAVALAVVLLQPASRVQPGSLASNPTTSAPVVAAADESITTRLWNAVIPPAGTLVADNPLRQELKSVYSDARSALDFLALNFLPSAQVAALTQSAPARTQG